MNDTSLSAIYSLGTIEPREQSQMRSVCSWEAGGFVGPSPPRKNKHMIKSIAFVVIISYLRPEQRRTNTDVFCPSRTAFSQVCQLVHDINGRRSCLGNWPSCQLRALDAALLPVDARGAIRTKLLQLPQLRLSAALPSGRRGEKPRRRPGIQECLHRLLLLLSKLCPFPLKESPQ